MKVAPAIRIGLTVLGALLVIAAFGAVLVIGASSNPPPLHVAVAARDLAIGDRLQADAYRLVDQVIDPALARLYVQEADLPQYEGAVVVDGLRRGDPLNKIKLAGAGTGEGLRRYALVLTRTDDVVMTLPVNPDIIPDRVSAGDYVNILFAGGGDAGINRLPDPTETPPEQPTYGRATPVPSSVALPVPTPNLTPTALLVLPLADLMLEHVAVVDVHYQQVQNPRASSDGTNAPSYIDGPITTLVVRVPRGYQTLLSFASVTGKLRFAIASPLSSPGDVKPRMGVDWKKYIDVYRWKELQTLLRGETLTQTLFPLYTPIVPATPRPTPQALP